MNRNRTENTIREPLTSDLIFKAVFGQDTEECKKALITVLNLILEREEDPITDLVYKNPFSIPEDRRQKEIIMDIRVETSAGEQIDIEMQVDISGAFADRMVLYGCKMAARGLDRGQEYVKMKKNILIAFVKGKIPSEEQNEQVHSMFTLREEKSHKKLSDILEFHFIELGKIPWRETPPEELGPLEQFGAYLLCSGDPDQQEYVEKLVQNGGEVISMTDKLLRKVSEEELIREARFDREWYELQAEWRRSDARKDGWEDGLTQGKKAIALEMKQDGVPTDKIARYTGLTETEIEEL